MRRVAHPGARPRFASRPRLDAGRSRTERLGQEPLLAYPCGSTRTQGGNPADLGPALLPQNVEDPFPASVIETVLLGRHPHIPRWQWESARDLAIASDALVAVGLAGYEERDVLTLSGGERRRAALAAVLAQTPRIFLLDEPTNQLDPNHQLEALQLLRERADAGAAVIVTLHDPNLAERFADAALLIGKDGAWRCGRVADILTPQLLSSLYDTRFEAVEISGRRVFYQA